jgi:hypothetical protein
MEDRPKQTQIVYNVQNKNTRRICVLVKDLLV